MLLGDEPGLDVAGQLYEAGLAAAGIRATCEVRHVAPTKLAAAIGRLRADRNVLGVAVSMPHAVTMATLLDGLGPEAQTIKAVNTVSHRAGALIGWNTDRPAFTLALEDAGYSARGRSALVLGAGGAARACVSALAESAAKIWVASQDLDQARSLCRDLEVKAGGPTPMGSLSLVVKKVDLIINATPVGSDGRSVLFPLDWITASQLVFDLIYQPAVTPLVQGARDRGARAINGLSMLLFAGLHAIEIWSGKPGDEAAMREALERAVLGQLSA